MTRRWKISMLVPALVGCALALGAAPAMAEFDPPTVTPIPTKTPPPDPDGGGGGGGGGPVVGQAGNCSVVSSPSYLGLSCGDGSMTTKSVKEILGKDDVPGCWNEKLSGAELEAMNLENRDASTWYWERCIKGIDLKTKKVEPGGVHFTIGIVSIKDGDKVVTLTKNQQTLVNMYSTDGTIPDPVAGVSPIALPYVNTDVSFFDGTQHVVEVKAGAVTLRAHVAGIEVHPLGEGTQPRLTCPGIGYKAATGETRADHPGCWHIYDKSSADQPNNEYPVNITAHWVVEVSTGGGFTFFNQFPKSQVTTVPVREIQVLNVP